MLVPGPGFVCFVWSKRPLPSQRVIGAGGGFAPRLRRWFFGRETAISTPKSIRKQAPQSKFGSGSTSGLIGRQGTVTLPYSPCIEAADRWHGMLDKCLLDEFEWSIDSFWLIEFGPIGTFVTVNIRFWASRAAPGRPGRAQNCPPNCPQTGPKTARFVS